jgi:hypothetical protein
VIVIPATSTPLRRRRGLLLMSADLGLAALAGVGNLIADTGSAGLDSLGRLPGALATRRLQPGEQPLPAL